MIGDRVELSEGFEALCPEEDYRYLGQDLQRDRLWLVRYQNSKRTLKADLMHVSISGFNEQKASGNVRVVHLTGSDKLPPWNQEVAHLEVADLDAVSRLAIPYSERVSQRTAAFGDAADNMKAWLFTDDPIQELNRRARAAGKNETRFRTQLLSYVASGTDPMALCPPFHRSGRWDRKDKLRNTKLGRSSKALGRNAGSPDDPKLNEIYLNGYFRYVDIGRPLTKIYAMINVKDLRCCVVSGRGRNQSRWMPPKGQKIYTYEQFRYRIRLKIGKENLQKNRYGAARHRTRNTPSEGRYSESLANLMEHVEADAFQVKERPRGYLEGSVLDPMWQVSGVDVLSGFGVGIGFSLGAERSAAYRMMLFSMAVPKVYFCALWGIEIGVEDWPSEGLPPHPTLDRGPGARGDLLGSLASAIPVKELVEAYMGQGKATVEGSHRKNLKTEGPPTFITSKLTPVALCRKLILDFIARNKRANVERRIEPIPEMAGVTPTPLGIWNFFDDRLRNDALPIRIESAVRTFLTPVDFKVEEDCVTLHGRRFNSKELKQSGFFRRYFSSHTATRAVQGFVMDLCVRHAWIDVDGKLYQLAAEGRFRIDEESLYVSLSELQEFEAALSVTRSETVETRHAANGEAIQRFEEQSQEDWNSEVRRSGRVKRTALSRRETHDARRAERGKSTR